MRGESCVTLVVVLDLDWTVSAVSFECEEDSSFAWRFDTFVCMWDWVRFSFSNSIVFTVVNANFNRFFFSLKRTLWGLPIRSLPDQWCFWKASRRPDLFKLSCFWASAVWYGIFWGCAWAWKFNAMFAMLMRLMWPFHLDLNSESMLLNEFQWPGTSPILQFIFSSQPWA